MRSAMSMLALLRFAVFYEQTGIVTDTTDFGQWYVGNYVHQLTPPESTLYVDDVTILPAP